MKIGEVANLLGLSPDAIRFYEKEGIVVPDRKGTGEYREYETWDIFYLLECIVFRKMGFSIKDIPSAKHKMSLAEISRQLESLAEKQREEIVSAQRLLEHLEGRKAHLELLPLNLGNYWIVQRPEYHYIVFTTCNGDRYGLIDPNDGLFAQWTQHYPYVRAAHVMDVDDLNAQAHNDSDWILMIETKMARTLNIPEHSRIKTTKAALCMTTVIDGGNRGDFSPDMLANVLQAIRQKGYRPHGLMMSLLATRCWEGEQFHRYFEVTVPIEKSSPQP